jgi:pyruvate dehydrogenase E2 component (dihydrolipoamide acetyltransferase)
VVVEVVVPEVGEMGMDVVFVRWRKRDGDTVEAGDILFELDTEKTVVEVEAWTSGTLTDLAVTEGDVVTPRQVVARILAPGEVSATARPESTMAATPGPAADTPVVPAQSASPAPPTETPSLSPRARALARELGIDPTTIGGTGPGGMVTEQDVRMAAASGGDR